MHTAHADIHEAGLADGCPRCDELAANPLELDRSVLNYLVELAVDPDRFDRGRSDTELRAAARILTMLENTGKLAEVAPHAVVEYLADRWRVRFTIAA